MSVTGIRQTVPTYNTGRASVPSVKNITFSLQNEAEHNQSVESSTSNSGSQSDYSIRTLYDIEKQAFGNTKPVRTVTFEELDELAKTYQSLGKSERAQRLFLNSLVQKGLLTGEDAENAFTAIAYQDLQLPIDLNPNDDLYGTIQSVLGYELRLQQAVTQKYGEHYDAVLDAHIESLKRLSNVLSPMRESILN